LPNAFPATPSVREREKSLAFDRLMGRTIEVFPANLAAGGEVSALRETA